MRYFHENIIRLATESERAGERGLVRVSRRCSFCQWFGFPAAGWSFSRTLCQIAAMGIRRPSDEMCNTTSVCASNNFISPVSLDGNLILDLCTPTWVLQLSRDRFDYKLNFCDLRSGAIFLLPESAQGASGLRHRNQCNFPVLRVRAVLRAAGARRVPWSSESRPPATSTCFAGCIRWPTLTRKNARELQSKSVFNLLTRKYRDTKF